jgi:phosphatidylglycerophosphate synthase
MTNRYELLTLPNILSLSRVVLLPVLFVLAGNGLEAPFVVCYAIVGATDFVDGLVARALGKTTSFGKTLDSLVDIPFYVASAWFLYRLHPEVVLPNAAMLVAFFALFAASFVVSAIRCGKPIMMHTFLLKLNAVLVYVLVILSSFLDTTLFVAAILVIYYVGFAEEILIFVLHGEVDPDSPSIFSLRPGSSPDT